MNRIIDKIKWVVLGILYAALGLAMVIAVASSSPTW